MPLPVNSPAPDFILPSTGGKIFQLSKDACGEAIIIYFYPKDFTAGCTKQSCSFRDEFQYFRNLHIKVIGISTDTPESHEDFKAAHQLPFELLSDTDGSISRSYQAKFPWLNISKRITYLLNQDHQIAAAFTGLFNAPQHIEYMKKVVG